MSQEIRLGSRAVTESLLRNLADGAPVTYQQVLNAPDDIALNAAYARTQIRQGDVPGAAATLERLLLRNPGQVDLKLIYGLVLFRLDDISTAQNVLSSIVPSQLTPEQREEYARVLNLIQQRNKALRQSISLTIGRHFDSNRNAAPNSGIIELGGLEFNLLGDALARRDWGNTIAASYEAEYDLGTDPRLSLYGGLSVADNSQDSVKTMNNQTGGLTIGLKFDAGPWNASAGVFWNHMTLQSETYLNGYGIAGHIGYRLRDDLEGFGDIKLDHQSFNDVPADLYGQQNSGRVSSVWMGLMWKPTPSHILSASLGGTHRNALADYNTNSRLALRLSDTWLLGKGQFLILAGEFGGNDYDANNPTIGSTTRHDHDRRLNLTYGLPAGTIAGALGGKLPEPLNDLVLSMSVEHYQDRSNILNYNYKNNRVQFLASKRWGF